MTLSIFDETLGALFIGVFVSGVLWGITCSQVFHYYTTRSKDSAIIKLLVAVAWVLDTSQQILAYAMLYEFCVTNYGNISFLMKVPATAPAQLALIVFTAIIVQGYYMSQIWRLSEGNRFITYPIIFLALAELGMGFGLVRSCATAGNSWVTNLHAQFTTGLGFSSLAFGLDTLITIIMCVMLYRKRTDFADTKSMIKKLMIFVMSTNLLTALFQMCFFIVYIVYPDKFYVIPMCYIATRLYANSFLAALNMRPYISSSHHDTVPESALQWAIPLARESIIGGRSHSYKQNAQKVFTG